MFAIIKFNSDSSVAVVPSPWLKDLSTCWWPPHNVARNAVVRQIPPSENWALHEVKVLNMKDNYEKAVGCVRKYVDGLCSTDDAMASSDPENRERRSKPSVENLKDGVAIKQVSKDVSNDDHLISEGCSRQIRNKTHPPPNIPNLFYDRNTCSPSSSESAATITRVGCSISPTNSPNQLTAFTKTPLSTQSSSSMNIQLSCNPEEPYSVQQLHSKIDLLKKHFDASVNSILREIISVKEYVMNSDRRLNSLAINRGIQIDLPVSIPVISITDVQVLNDWLDESNDNKSMLARQLSLSGCNDLQKCVRRIFYRVISPECAQRYTYTGRTKSGIEKIAFKDLQLNSVIRQAVQLCANFGPGIEKRLDTALQDVLRYNIDKLNKRSHAKRLQNQA